LSLLGGGTTKAGVTVTHDSAMTTSAVWGCVRVLSETVGSLPVAIYKSDSNGNAERAPDHPLARVLLGSPNANMTSQEMFEAMMVSLALAGNAYAIIERSTRGDVISITPYPAQMFTPELTPRGAVVYKFAPPDGQAETLPAEKVWHVKGFGSNGLVGYSPVSYARQAIGMALATEDFGATFFRNGAKATGIITAKEFLTDKQRAATREGLEKFWSGLVNAHKVQLLEGGMTYQNVVMPLEDAQFLETRKFQITEICRMYRVPPHMVADLDRATFTNIEQQTQDFLQYTLLPYFVRFEQSAQKRLFKPGERGTFSIKFNPEGLLRGDSAARAQLYNTLLQNGVYNRNDVRAKENLPRSDAAGMDDYTVQANMIDIRSLGKGAANGKAGQ
jgi:HK97 family phage portal protein